jgi:hypothetical protein
VDGIVKMIGGECGEICWGGGAEHLMGDVEGVERWDFFLYICVEDNGYTGCFKKNSKYFRRW